MGQVFAELQIPRSDIVLTTKVFFGSTKEPKPSAKGLSRKHIIEGVKASLQRMRMDYVDVVYAHRPDPTTPIEETVRAFNYVIDNGMAFYWGTSEWSTEQIQEAHAVASRLGLIGPSVEQPQYNLLHRRRVEIEYEPLYKQHGLGLTPWSPLASGLLSGKYSSGKKELPEGSRFTLERYKFLGEKYLQEDKLKAAAALGHVAEELGATSAQLALAWCAANPNVSSVLTGASKVEQVRENLKALEFLPKLTPDVMQRISEATGSTPDIEVM